ncbi:hypothetical protein NX841_28675 [Burkholderia thailandensis]|nr:hypothetical protein [Burkholderia thailandensis]
MLFEAPLAAGLLGAFVQAVGGRAVLREASVLVDTLGEEGLVARRPIAEDPHLADAVGRAALRQDGGRARAHAAGCPTPPAAASCPRRPCGPQRFSRTGAAVWGFCGTMPPPPRRPRTTPRPPPPRARAR